MATKRNNILIMFLILLFWGLAVRNNTVTVSAADNGVAGIFYESNIDGKDFDFISESAITEGEDRIGTFGISGIVEKKKDNEYRIKDIVTFSYSINNITNDTDSWRLSTDNTKKVGKINLNDKMKSGAIVVQTSLDGERWITDTICVDTFNTVGSDPIPFYTTNMYQLVNGCYYRVFVAYRLERNKENATVFSKLEYKNCIETYEFFLQDPDVHDEIQSIDRTAEKQLILGKTNRVKSESGNYTSDKIKMKKSDPHFSRDLGRFYLKGFTSDTQKNNRTVLLKKPGNRISLSFELDERNLEALWGNKNIYISYDEDGADGDLSIRDTPFKRGMLIIEMTDRENRTKTVTYSDFLAACTTKNTAETDVYLFEEGDYKVALDYEICNRWNPSFKGNYRIAFEFSIRNANAMAFPRDISSGSELSDNDYTEEGFWVDYAGSKYITVNIESKHLQKRGDSFKTDTRYNGAINDTDRFTAPGIYTFSVVNDYTGKETVKTIYVGKDPFIKALSVNGLSIQELERELDNNAIIQDDGTLYREDDFEDELLNLSEENIEEPSEEPLEEPILDSEPFEDGESMSLDSADTAMTSDEATENVASEENESYEEMPVEDTDNMGWGTWVILAILASFMGLFILKQQKKNK